MPNTPEVKIISSLGAAPYSLVESGGDVSVLMGFFDRSRREIVPIGPRLLTSPLPVGSEFHSHAFYEMIYVLDGTFTQHLENVKYGLNAGDVTFLGKSIRHFEGSETKSTCLYLLLSQSFLDSLFRNDSDSLKIMQNQQSSQLFRHFAAPGSDTLPEQRVALDFRRTLSSQVHLDSAEILPAQKLLNELSQLVIDRPWGYFFSVQGLMLRLFELLEDKRNYHATIIQPNTSSEETLYAEIQHYLLERSGRITRQELSALLHYNPDYLGRVVKRQSGLSFTQYSQQLWLDKARSLLTSTDMSISDIIRSLAFENRHYFYRVFFDKTGMTPQEYRQQNRN